MLVVAVSLIWVTRSTKKMLNEITDFVHELFCLNSILFNFLLFTVVVVKTPDNLR